MNYLIILLKKLSLHHEKFIFYLKCCFIHFYTFCEKEINVSDLPKRVSESKSFSLSLEDSERQHISKVFQLKNGNQSETASSLGVSRDTLRRKLQKYGILESKE